MSSGVQRGWQGKNIWIGVSNSLDEKLCYSEFMNNFFRNCFSPKNGSDKPVSKSVSSEKMKEATNYVSERFNRALKRLAER